MCIYIYIVGLYSLYYLSLLITVTQDPSCFLSHLNIRAKIVQNVFKEFFTFKDIQRLYRLRLLVAMAIGRHLLLLSLARSHRTRFVPVRLLCTQDWSWGPKRCVKPDHMCYVDHYVFLYIQFLKMEEKKKGKKKQLIIMRHEQSLCYRPSEHVIRGVSTHLVNATRISCKLKVCLRSKERR